MSLKEQIAQLVEEKIAGTDYFMVDVKTSPSKVSVFIDHPQGIKLADCVDLNRFIQSRLDSEGVLETHELEVSSPGIDEPLKVKGQYLKAIGKNISVLMKDGIRKDGILKSVDEKGTCFELEPSRVSSSNSRQTRNTEHETEMISLEEIKETKVIFSFNKKVHG